MRFLGFALRASLEMTTPGHKNGQKRGRRMVVGIWLRHKLSCSLDGIGETVGPIIADIEFHRDSVLEAVRAYFY